MKSDVVCINQLMPTHPCVLTLYQTRTQTVTQTQTQTLSLTLTLTQTQTLSLTLTQSLTLTLTLTLTLKYLVPSRLSLSSWIEHVTDHEAEARERGHGVHGGVVY